MTLRSHCSSHEIYGSFSDLYATDCIKVIASVDTFYQ